MKVKKSRIIAYTVLIAYVIISLFPFFWALMVSITPLNYYDTITNEQKGIDIMQWPPKINFFKGEVFGAPMTFENYIKIFQVAPLFARWIINTFIYAGLITLGHVLIDTLGGYAFARLKFPFKDLWFMLFLATMMVPGQIIMIPQYTMMVNYGLINTYAGLFLPKLTGVFGLFLLRQFFLNFPKELEEAARIDGAGIIKTYFKVVLPNAKPAVSALAIYSFLGAWNELMWPLLVTTKKEMYTLAMGLNFFKTSYYTFWQYLMAASIIMTVPMVIIFLSFQKEFVETGRSAAVKG